MMFCTFSNIDKIASLRIGQTLITTLRIASKRIGQTSIKIALAGKMCNVSKYGIADPYLHVDQMGATILRAL